MSMKTISTTNVRKQMKSLIDVVKETGEVIAIGRRNNIEAILIKFPREYNKNVSDITNVNVYSPSFDFLEKEPDLYSIKDLKKKYV